MLALLPRCGGSHDGSAGHVLGRFLDSHELEALRAVTARLVPGPPEDPDPGAIEAGVADAIDHLLGAFEGAVAPIHAGGPFSGRADGGHDDFADFVPLDALAELGWRIRIEGSLGLPEREFAGPVIGLQQIYRNGLARLDERAAADHGTTFVALTAADQDALLGGAGDDVLEMFLGTAIANTLDFMYGPPEYGGNRGLVGWRYTGWDGDNQPRGYTDEEVSTLDAGAARIEVSADAADRLLDRFGPLLGARRSVRRDRAGQAR